MYRGTTSTFVWEKLDKDLDLKSFDLTLEDIEELWLTFKIGNSESNLLTKKKDDVDIDLTEKNLSYIFTQEETLTFSVGEIEVQIRVLMNNDMALATPIKVFNVERILKGGIIEKTQQI